LLDGTIDALVSDHTPVDDDAKTLPFAEAEPGATGLELLLSLALKWGGDQGKDQSKGGLMRTLQVLTSAPAAVLGESLGTLASSAGQLVKGGVADICVFDPSAEWTPEPAALRSQGKHTPFSSHHLQGRVSFTLVGGHVAFQSRAGA
jgi:dihydroorotase